MRNCWSVFTPNRLDSVTWVTMKMTLWFLSHNCMYFVRLIYLYTCTTCELWICLTITGENLTDSVNLAGKHLNSHTLCSRLITLNHHMLTLNHHTCAKIRAAQTERRKLVPRGIKLHREIGPAKNLFFSCAQKFPVRVCQELHLSSLAIFYFHFFSGKNCVLSDLRRVDR